MKDQQEVEDAYDLVSEKSTYVPAAAGQEGTYVGFGSCEWQDVLSVHKWKDTQPDLKHLDVVHVSFCTGANAVIKAIAKEPTAFTKTKCVFACQPANPSRMIENLIQMKKA